MQITHSSAVTIIFLLVKLITRYYYFVRIYDYNMVARVYMRRKFGNILPPEHRRHLTCEPSQNHALGIYNIPFSCTVSGFAIYVFIEYFLRFFKLAVHDGYMRKWITLKYRRA